MREPGPGFVPGAVRCEDWASHGFDDSERIHLRAVTNQRAYRDYRTVESGLHLVAILDQDNLVLCRLQVP